jgi:phage gpG-like protein
MKTSEAQKRGLGWMRGILVNIAAFFDIRSSGSSPGVAMQAAETSFNNTTSFDAAAGPAAGPAAGEIKTVEEVAVEAFLKGMASDVQKAFDTATDPVTGIQWPARAIPADHPLLVLTGRLRAAAIGAVQTAVPTGYGIEINLAEPDYGFFHQFGTSRMPQRRFLGASPGTLESTMGTVMDAVNNLMVDWGR